MTKQAIEYASCGVGAIMTVVQTNQIFQLISLILTCVATAVALGFTIYKWVKAAIADGKIDKEEIKELVDIVEDGAKEIIDKVEDYKEHKDNE